MFSLIKLARNSYFKALTDLLSRDLKPARVVYQVLDVKKHPRNISSIPIFPSR